MRGWTVAMVVLLGCGPQVGVPEGDGSTGGDATSTSGASVGSTRGDDTGRPMTTAVPPSPSTTVGDDGPNPGTTLGDDTTTDRGDIDSGEDMCDCQGRPVDVRTPLDEGYTAADVLAFVASTSYAWTWSAIEGQPQTTLQVDVLYEGGAVIDEVSGCCGSFLCVPCPIGVTIEAYFRLTSSDGLLDEYVPATITGTIEPQEYGEGIYNVSAQVALASLQGSLPAQMFADRNGPVIVDTIALIQTWEWNGADEGEPHAYLVGNPAAVLLGEAQSP